LYFDNTKTGAVKDTIALNKADIAFENRSVSCSDSGCGVYRARTNNLFEMMN
jgi:hypothetical protein